MRERQGILTNIDGILLLLWLVLSVTGCFSIYSATTAGDPISFLDLSAKHGRQLIFWGVSVIAIFVILTLDYKFITRSSFLFYFVTIGLLLLTLIIGDEIKGSRSWIRFGGFQIQPAEFAKIGVALALSSFFANTDNPFNNKKEFLLLLGIIALPMGLILLQGDFGSMMIYTILIFVLYREGLAAWPIYSGLLAIALALSTLLFGFLPVAIAIVIIAAIIFWRSKQKRRIWKPMALIAGLAIGFSGMVTGMFYSILKPYQQDRVLILLGLKEDLKGAGYNLWQSKMAVGSGGFAGKGFRQGTQTQGDFVPEVSTDYIFASIGEEWGFIGSLFVLGLFSYLIYRLIFLAERQRSIYSRVFIYCVAGFFFMHTFVNIAMVIGLFPTVGIPLPFFSYGGSSLLAFSIMIAMVLRLDAERLFVLR